MANSFGCLTNEKRRHRPALRGKRELCLAEVDRRDHDQHDDGADQAGNQQALRRAAARVRRVTALRIGALRHGLNTLHPGPLPRSGKVDQIDRAE